MLNQTKLKEQMAKNGINLKGKRILAGFSGGSDSVALCHLLAELRRELGFSLELIYIQHGLRGKESEKEEEFVRNWAKQQDCPLHVQKVDVIGKAKEEKLSIETAARVLRHQVFQEQMRKADFDLLALAHHAKDQAETVLMHFLRGSGVTGLVGMKVQSQSIFRPLLAFSKSEIMQYLQSAQLEWSEDSTNSSLEYRRNRIRMELLPYLQKYFNPNLVNTIVENATQMAELEEYLSLQTETAFREAARQSEGEWLLSVPILEKMHIYMQKTVVRKAIAEVKGNMVNIEKVHIERAVSLMGKPAGKQEDLVDGIVCQRHRDWLVFRQKKEQSGTKGRDIFPLRLDILQGKRYIKIIGRFVFVSKILDKPTPKRKQTEWTQCFDLEQMPSNLVFRYAMPKDYLIINEQGNKKKLRDFLADQKVRQDKRQEVPVLANGDEIIWVIGHRIAYPYRITDNTKVIMECKILGGQFRVKN